MVTDDRETTEHDLIGVSDEGFGYQAWCSCGWRTGPKEGSWEAGAVWRTHLEARLGEQQHSLA